MDALLRGSVRNVNLPKDHGLDTVLEAVVNSIQAIHLGGGSTVIVRYIYDKSQRSLDPSRPTNILDGFEIQDDGPGFNPFNLESFDTINTEAKLELGCKGIGRLLWLKAFDNVEIDSSYDTEEGTKRVAFRFHTGRDRYRDEEPRPFDGGRRTIVSLRGIIRDYRKSMGIKPDTMARRILNHCFTYFVNWDMPIIYVESSEGRTCVNDLYDERLGNKDEMQFLLKDERFTMTCFRFYGWREYGNRVEFCADGRTVKSLPIFKGIRLIDDEGEEFVFCAYLSGEILDETVNDVRTEFAIQPHMLDPDEISMDELVNEVMQRCRSSLGPALARDERRRKERLDAITTNYPELGLICDRDPTIIDGISADMTELDLYKAINRYGADMDAEAVFDVRDLMGRKMTILANDECQDVLDRLKGIQSDTLARYVIQRRLTIEMLERGMERWLDTKDGEERFPYEDYMHNILLPKRVTPDSPPDINSCNLWILDERLNYYAFVGSFSDIYMKRITGVEDKDRPDIAVFSEISGGVCRSVALVELKRYDVEDYDMERQMKRYVKKMTDAGHIELQTGRKVSLTPETTFHCFGICDLTTDYGDELEMSNYRKVYGGRGYFQWFPLLNAMIEFIDYGKVATDAKLRNQVFFDILGIKDVRRTV